MISTSRILICMDSSFVKNLLPMIDSEASQQGKTRADVIRSVLYSHHHHHPRERSPEQLVYDSNIEQQYNKEGYTDDTLIALPCLWVCVDRKFFDMYMIDILSRSKDDEEVEYHYWKTTRKILQQHFYHETARACTTT